MRSLELFSGAGGLALGLEKAGFTNVGLIENNRDACATLRLNRPHWNLLESDIEDIDFHLFKDVDLIAGGPPCQPFSIGGKARGYDDRRDMFPQAVRAVRELSPAAFIFENVRGLLRQSFRNYVEYIRLQLTYPDFPVSQNISWDVNLQRLQKHHTSHRDKSALTYQVSIHEADAANYGVPQRRHRVFFIGFRSDLNAQWFFPSPTHSRDQLLREQYISCDYWNHHGFKATPRPPERLLKKVSSLTVGPLFSDTARWKTVRDALKGLPHPKDNHQISNHNFQPGAKIYPGHTGSPFDEPSKALKAGDHGVPGGENMLNYGNGKVRYFTVRECARIQTFPDTYHFTGSWSEAMRQLGNAVPVSLAYCVSKSIHRHLQHVKEERTTI